MQTHVVRSQSGIFFKTYRLSVRLYVDPEEQFIIRQHRLDRIEVFADPLRDAFADNATAAHDKAKARGLIVTRARDAAAISASEISALVSTVRSMLAFKLQVSDLLQGVTIQHRSLRAIADIETVCTDVIDRIDAAVRAARSYDHRSEDIFAPGNDQEETVPPGEWTRGWRR